jgi:cation diffusion facilitator CzcD-associated flavoprotein CzcO
MGIIGSGATAIYLLNQIAKTKRIVPFATREMPSIDPRKKAIVLQCFKA